jgi:phosphatidylserine decarboxylase
MISLVLLNAAAQYLTDIMWLHNTILIASVIFYALVINFFRNPVRHIHFDPYSILAPCDGKVVVIENVLEEEYFTGKRQQISIFMSPLNVHVNRYPISGTITSARYHPGKFLVAWHPKASTLNERTTVVVKGEYTGEIMYRQIAGALARRIVMYAKRGSLAKQGEDSGFIKFGSRVDLFIPLDMAVDVKIGQVVRGGETIIAHVSKPENI